MGKQKKKINRKGIKAPYCFITMLMVNKTVFYYSLEILREKNMVTVKIMGSSIFLPTSAVNILVLGLLVGQEHIQRSSALKENIFCPTEWRNFSGIFYPCESTTQEGLLVKVSTS